MAAVTTTTKTKQVNKKRVKDVKTIEIVSKSKYEKLERRLKNEKSKNGQLTQLVYQQGRHDFYLKKFIGDYLKPRYRPRYDEDGNELWSMDGHSYSTLFVDTLHATSDGRYPAELNEEPLTESQITKLQRLRDNICGKPTCVQFKDPNEEKDYVPPHYL